jgi:subtilisin-like proprotein convertase family protein
MKLKNTLLLFALTAILFSCQKEEESVVIDTTADLTVNSAVYDESNYGVYEGVFSTLDSETRGVVVVSLKPNNNGGASLKLNNGTEFKLAAIENYSKGADTNVLFSGGNTSFRFSVNRDGTDPVVSDVVYSGQDSSIKVLKETSSAPVVPLTGSFNFTGTTQTGTFSAIFNTGDGSVDDVDVTTQIIFDGFDLGSGPASNSQTGCTVDSPMAGFTSCTVSGTSITPNTANPIMYSGTHVFNQDPSILCSEFNGTWSAGQGQMGTFTNDIKCLPQPGDFPATAITLVPNAEGTGCTPTGDVTVNLAANGGYTDSGEADTACTNTGTDVWFTYTSTTNGLNIFPQSPSNTAIPSVAAYAFNASGGTYTELSCAAGNFGGAATIAINGWTAGDVVFIRMQSTDEVPFCAEEVTVATGPPANDNCVSAEVIACGDTVMGSTLTATDGDAARAADVWYTLSGTAAGEIITVSLCGSAFDTWLGVYDDCAQTTLVTSNDDDCGPQSEVTFTSTGIAYTIKVDGFASGNVGDYTLAITCVAAPTCTDGILNQDETGIDCGGATCPACPPAPACTGVTTTENGGFGDIADNSCPAGTLFVATTAEIGTIGTDMDIDNVEINITHSWMSDLTVNLVSPAGTSMVLAQSLGAGQGTAGGNAYIDTVFRDGEATITSGAAPFTGNFEAQGGRFGTVFTGESITGDWALSICDANQSQTGTLNGFTISFCDGVIMDPPAPPPAPAPLMKSAADKAEKQRAIKLYNQKQKLKK